MAPNCVLAWAVDQKHGFEYREAPAGNKYVARVIPRPSEAGLQYIGLYLSRLEGRLELKMAKFRELEEAKAEIDRLLTKCGWTLNVSS